MIVAGNMSASNAKDLSREFSFSRSLRPDTKRPVWHCSLGLPEGDSLDIGTWDRISNRFLEEMGVDTGNHQFVVVKHHDTDKEHVHIVMSRIGLDSQLWHGRKDVMQAIEATQTLEKEFGLTLTAGYFELDENGEKVKRKVSKRDPKPQETQMSARTGEAPKRLVLQQIIDEATSTKTDVFSFIEQLECAGVTVRPNVAKTGRLNGFSFEYQGIPFKGSDLGDDYKWSERSKLKQNVTYEQTRDSKRLIAEAERIKQAASKPSPEATEDKTAGQPTHIQDHDRDSAKHDSVSSGLEKEQPRVAEGPEPDSHQQQGVGNNNPERSNSTGQSNRERSQPDGDSHQQGVQRAGQGHQKSTGNPTLDKLENQVSDLRSRAGNWNAANNTVADLAAPLVTNPKSSKQSPDQLKKVEAWRSQHEALNAKEYRITLIPRKDGAKPWVLGKNGDKERFYSHQQVEEQIPLMRQKNAQGYDIYITPIDEGHHFIVVDDLTTQQHMAIMKEGYKPNLVQESSKDNRQAIFKIPKQGEPDEQQAANAVVVELNREYGDKNFSGVVHPFRMAGFSNKKAGRNNAFTRILSRSFEACRRVSETLKHKIESAKQQRNKQAIVSRVKGMDDYPQFGKDAESHFKREWSKVHGLATKKGWEIDYSRIDFQAVKASLEAGINPDELEQAILEHSPSVLDRKNNPEDYAQRTVKAAQGKAKPPAEKPAEQPKPPAEQPKRKPKRDKNGTIIGWIDE
ncbi:relaxase/mobilization nuclease domain-containing protein [Vibrio antiquarius]|uniref:relaxase/mobilization nuclease domain-containing protein n=1 Tax=Vibrio antiquarius (strain Ex25) TaxID=150340 RepID=UPI003F6899EE